jgi:hypothetical protein
MTRPPVSDLLGNPDAVLYRSDLFALGYSRKAVDAIFRAIPLHVVPGYSKPQILVRDFLRHRDDGWTYRDDRVRAA